jgi:hypothetical protein
LEVLDHPARSQDFAPSDFHLFLHLKKYLPGQKFQEDEEVTNEVTTWLRAQAANCVASEYKNWYGDVNKILDRGGDYVE